MSQARLRSLRMVGFKSFAEKTVVEFGPGISAVVGPNGSGKSNLADALRWALGEQGRSLRTRRAEDLIFAGSSTRRAHRHGRRDAGHRQRATASCRSTSARSSSAGGSSAPARTSTCSTASASGCATSSTCSTRRTSPTTPSCSSARAWSTRRWRCVPRNGGRCSRRRPGSASTSAGGAQAEAELAEAEANLERVRDLLAELRPQARRLAAQAEQQEQRRSAGAELSAALVAAAKARLGEAEREAARQATALGGARRDADSALAALREAEETVQALARGLAERAEAETAARTRLDAARAATIEQKLAEMRHSGEAQARGAGPGSRRSGARHPRGADRGRAARRGTSRARGG